VIEIVVAGLLLFHLIIFQLTQADQMLCVCLDVNPGGRNRKRCTPRLGLVILRALSY